MGTKIWLPRVLKDKKGNLVYTYATKHGELRDVLHDDMTMQDMTNFMIGFISAQITKMKEHALAIKAKLSFDMGTPAGELDNEFYVHVKIEQPDDIKFKFLTEEDIEDDNGN